MIQSEFESAHCLGIVWLTQEVESRGQIANAMLNWCCASESDRRIRVSCVYRLYIGATLPPLKSVMCVANMDQEGYYHDYNIKAGILA